MTGIRRFAVPALTLVMIAVSVVVTASGIAQPPPCAPGVPAPDIADTYLAAQSDPSLSDTDKVRSAVDTYFTLKYEGRLRETALDLSVVVDTASKDGRSLHDYELGRLQYSIVCHRVTETFITDYLYRPVYESLEIHRNKATVRVRPWILVTYANNPDCPAQNGGEPHTITLARGESGWRIVDDEYRDEFTMLFPRGTDFAALERSLPSRLQEQQREWAEIESELRADPRTAYRFEDPAHEIDLAGYRSYDRNRCSWYGMTYTNGNKDCSTTDYNPLFVEYASEERGLPEFRESVRLVWIRRSEHLYGHSEPRSAHGLQHQRCHELVGT